MTTSSLRLSNNGLSTLAAGITDSDTSLTVATGDGAKFPVLAGGQYFMLTLVKSSGTFEIVKVTARSTDTLTIVRAQEGTVASAFSMGDRLEHRLTAGSLLTELENKVQVDGSGNIEIAGNISDQYGSVRDIPKSGSAKTTGYTLLATDAGQHIEVGSGGSITIPDATFAAGDAVTIFNNTTGNVTITCSITTAYIGGTDADKATVTLATRGVATVLFVSGTVCVIGGNVT